jgi:hypothetical protein
VETKIYIERLFRCNNCQEELASEYSRYASMCPICKDYFVESNDIICIERSNDANIHYHKNCFENQNKKKPDAPMPIEKEIEDILDAKLKKE